MSAPFRAAVALAGLIAGLSLQGRVDAGFIPVSRLSEITFNGVGLGTGGEPGPDASASTTDLSATVSEVLAGSASNVEPGGAFDSGEWNISQETTISSDVIASSHFQSATTTTDFGSPGIFTRSLFEFEFQVDSASQVLLEGSIVGSSNPADNPFARVQLMQGTTTLFNTGLANGTFPFVTTLDANLVYTLIVDVSGESLFNNTTSSSAEITLSIVPAAVPEPSSMAMGGLGIVGLVVWTRTRNRCAESIARRTARASVSEPLPVWSAGRHDGKGSRSGLPPRPQSLPTPREPLSCRLMELPG